VFIICKSTIYFLLFLEEVLYLLNNFRNCLFYYFPEIQYKTIIKRRHFQNPSFLFDITYKIDIWLIIQFIEPSKSYIVIENKQLVILSIYVKIWTKTKFR